jgi:NitT/TauT family transport system substrate-binding protein
VPPGGVSRRARKGASLALATLTAVLAAAAPSGARAAAPAKLRILVLPHLTHGVFYLARDLGHFAAQGLDVEFVKLDRSSGAIPLLLRGDLDVMAAAPGPAVFNAIAGGERLRVVAGMTVTRQAGCAGSGLVVRSGLELTPGLRGLRISANRSQIGGYLLERLLAARGLDAGEQQFLDLNSAEEAAAFLDGRLDVTVVGDPWRTRLEDAGAARLVLPTRDALPGLQTSVLLYGPRLLADRELGTRFATAYLEAVAAYEEGHTPRNLDLFSRALDVEHDLLDRSCWWTVSVGGRLETEGLVDYQRWEVERGRQDRVLNPTEYWDGELFERAAQGLADRAR